MIIREYDEYKETTVNSAFITINTKLSEIFNDATKEKLESYSRRWIWELIQNSCDTENEFINIKVTFDSKQNTVSFCHDGMPFDKRSLLSLITQISEKVDLEDKAGQFGTGFITTHLLSKRVRITGAYCKKDTQIVGLNFDLDRTAWIENTSSKEFSYSLKEQIRKNLDDLDDIETMQAVANIKHETEFMYFLNSSETIEAVNLGIKDLISHIPLLFAFNKINSITINGEKYISQSIPTIDIDNIDLLLSKFRIYKNTEYICDVFNFKHKREDISLGVCSNNYIIPYLDNTARIFCRFPLVGSEGFGIPFVVNSKLFQVNEKRDSLQQSNEINKKIMDEAIKLYDRSIDFFMENSIGGLLNFCITKEKKGNTDLSDFYFKKSKEIYSNKKIVKTVRGQMKTLKEIKIPSIENYNFPKEMDEVTKDNIRKDYFKLLTHCKNIDIPEFEYCMDWLKTFKEAAISLEDLAEDISANETILNKLNNNWVEWLNLYLSILFKLKKREVLKSKSIYVNQKNSIVSLEKYFLDIITDEKLKEIYNGFFENEKEYIEHKLIHREIELKDDIFQDFINLYTDEMIAKEISTNVINTLAKERGNENKRDDRTQDNFNKLFYWIKANEDKAQNIFNSIYDNRMSLCSNTIQIENYAMAEEAKKFLADNNVSSFREIANVKLIEIQQHQTILEDEIDKLLNTNTNDVTEEMILDFLRNMSISCEDELKKFLEASGQSAEKIKKFLEYRSSGLQRCYLKVQDMLKDAAERVKAYLSLRGYDLANVNRIAPTVYDGIKRNNEDIVIVIRPSNNKKIILYYDSEPTYLRKNYELWVVDTDNQIDIPKQLTLGDILKLTGIKVIPLRNLFL